MAIGVRSSCEASATRLRCDCDRALERVERRVEASAPAARARRCPAPRGARSRAVPGCAAIASVWRVKRAIGASAVRGDEDPQQRRERDPRRRDHASAAAARCDSVWSTSVQRQRDGERAAAPTPVTSTRMCVPLDASRR